MDEADIKQALLHNSIYIRQIDKRAGYQKDKLFPSVIFIATLLRWNVQGFYWVGTGDEIANPDVDTELVRQTNSSAVASSAMLLADLIEAGEVPVYSAHTKLALGSIEASELVARLNRANDSDFWSWVDNDGCSYYVDGLAVLNALDRRKLLGSDGLMVLTLRNEIGSANASKKQKVEGHTGRGEAGRVPTGDVATPEAMTSNEDEAHPRTEREEAESPPDWKAQARAIALEYLNRHWAKDLYPTQKDVCDNAEKVMRERKIYGVYGKPLGASTIQSEAIKGEWWQKNSKKRN